MERKEIEKRKKKGLEKKEKDEKTDGRSEKEIRSGK